MKEYKVTFQHLGLKQQETVLADDVFKAQEQIEDKYGIDNVRVSVVASTSNRWM